MRMRVILGAAVTAAGVGAFIRGRQWWATWGHDPAEAERVIPGDDLVGDAKAVDTRGITIEAPPVAVWPWLVQMGYGRAGWYSYDRMDMKGRSADEIHPEWQSLSAGDVMATDPGGGFVVRELEPERVLVLYIDDAIVRSQRGPGGAAADLGRSEVPAGLEASGRLMGSAMPGRFAASWAFVLEPLGESRTRLIERVRFGAEDRGGARAAAPFLGFGVFVMMQKQMREIAARAEGAPRDAVGAGGEEAQPV